MRILPRLGALWLLATCGAGAQTAAPALHGLPWAAPVGSTQVWNGRDLSGLTVFCKDGAVPLPGFWSVEKGELHLVGKQSGYLRTEKVFSNYHLHAEWRWPGTPQAGINNSGIFVAQRPPDAVWPYSVQVQLKEGLAGDLIGQNGLILPGADSKSTVPKMAAPSEKPAGEWNGADIYCRGVSLEVFINGTRQNSVEKLPASSGQVALQMEGYAVDFRNVWLEPLGAPLPAQGTTALEWSQRMAGSEMARIGEKLDAPPQGKGRWDYTTGMYADSLIRLTERTGDPVYEKTAEGVIGSFIGPFGRIDTYESQHKHKPPAKKKTPLKKGAAKNNPAKKEPAKKPPAKKAPAKNPAPPPGKKTKKLPPYSLDEVQSGVATLELYDLTHQVRYRWAAGILRRQLRKHPRTGEGGFWHKAYYPHQMWLDGLYMAEPFYARYAVRFQEPADFGDIARQFELIDAHTYNAKTGLFYHGWDETKSQPWASKVTGDSPSFWSRAIGWYAMGLVDVLEVMPSDHPQRPALERLFRKVCAGVLDYQDSRSGLWWQVIDQGHHRHNYLEASASCMFVYALAKGVNLGLLPRRDIPAIHAGYTGIVRHLITVGRHGEINLTHCCEVAGLDAKWKGRYAYYTQHTKVVANDLKGVSPFINAGLECQRLFGRETFAP